MDRYCDCGRCRECRVRKLASKENTMGDLPFGGISRRRAEEIVDEEDKKALHERINRDLG